MPCGVRVVSHQVVKSFHAVVESPSLTTEYPLSPPTIQLYSRTFMEEQNLDKAREILDGMSHYRVDPTRIKMTDATGRQKGGQGVVGVGTISLPETVKALVWKLKSLAENNALSLERFRMALHELKEKLKIWPPEIDAMAEMIEASPQELDKWRPEMKVAVKMLAWDRADTQESTKFFKSFVYELSLMTELCHPNVVRLGGFVEDLVKGDAWMILPWESNGNVREFLQSGEWDIPERISLIQDTASGLEYLHSRQPPICHGDLKSLKILVNSCYRAVITDFGSARIRRNVAPGKKENPLVNDGGAAGLTSPEVKFSPSTKELTLTGPGYSLRWTAPEVLAGEEQDLPSDMWAIGWICWEIVTGRIPFEELNKETAIVMRTIKGNLPAIREDTDLSHVLKLCSLISECWDLEPVERIDASAFQRRVRTMPSAIPSAGYAPGGQKTRSARLLIQLGQMYHAQANFSKAMDCYQSTVDVATRTRDEAMKGHALGRLGELYRLQGRHGEAEQAFIEAHGVHSLIGDNEGVANALRDLGNLYRDQWKNSEAEKVLMEAYEIASRIGNIRCAAQALHSLGRIYLALSMSQKAETALTKAYEMHSGVGDDLGVADALDGLGKLYRAQSKHGEAEKALMAAHEIHSRIGNHMGAANALIDLGNTYRAQSRNREAEKAFNDAYKILPLLDSSHTAGNTFRSLGMLHHNQCRYDEAEVSYRQALAAYDQADAADSKSRTLVALGMLYHAKGQYLEAEEAVTEALAVWISLGNEACQAAAYLVLERIFESQSKHAEVIAVLMQAEAALARTSYDADHAKTLHRLGDIHVRQGMYAEAEGYYRHAQAIFSNMEDARGEAGVLDVLGACYVFWGRYGEAEKCFAQARVACGSVADEDGEATALDKLMGLYFFQRKLGDAKVACMEACKMYAQRGQPMSEMCAKVWEVLQQLDE